MSIKNIIKIIFVCILLGAFFGLKGTLILSSIGIGVYCLAKIIRNNI